MTTTHVLVNAMDVGQGLGTYVQLFDRQPAPTVAPTHSVLVDFGCLGDSEPAGTPRIAWVTAELKRMAQPTLDALYISHGDGDHYNLLPQLLKNFGRYDPGNGQSGSGTLRIRYCHFAGSRKDFNIKATKKEGAYNLIDKIDNYMSGNDGKDDNLAATGASRGGTSFDGLNTTPDRVVDNLRCYVVIEDVNAATVDVTSTKTFKGGSYGDNTRSMVVLLEFLDGAYQYLSTGDATGRTIFECKNVFREKIMPGDHYLSDVVGMTIPHHGAAATLFAMYPKSTTDEIVEHVVRDFVEIVKPRTLLASASEGNSYKHPHAQVLRYFWEGVRRGGYPIYNDPALGGTHFYTAYFLKDQYTGNAFNPQTGRMQRCLWPNTTGYYSVKTPWPVYSALCYSSRYDDENYIVVPPEPAVAVATPPGNYLVGATWVIGLQRGVDPGMQPLASRLGEHELYEPAGRPRAGVAVREPALAGRPGGGVAGPVGPAGSAAVSRVPVRRNGSDALRELVVIL